MRYACLVLTLLCCFQRVRAETKGDAIALALFEDGRAFAARGDFARACAKFEAARARVTWVGVALNLADCYERIGKTASAWALFRKTGDDAATRADSRAAYARTRADKLQPYLAHVTIARADGSALHIQLDHQPLAIASLGRLLPVDPGEHVLEAGAPGSVPWSRRIVVEPQATVEIRIPPLAPVAVTVAPIAPAHPQPRRRWWPASLATIGALAVGTSIVLGLDARRDFDAARTHCDVQLRCNQDGFDAIRDARRRGNVATITGGGGLATIAAAAILYWWPAREQRTRLVPIATLTTVGIGVGGPL
jgi:hypothetical protein